MLSLCLANLISISKCKTIFVLDFSFYNSEDVDEDVVDDDDDLEEPHAEEQALGAGMILLWKKREKSILSFLVTLSLLLGLCVSCLKCEMITRRG